METGRKEFIKNVLDVKVDGLRGVNRYIVKAMYNVEKRDALGTWWEICLELIEDLEMSWNEIEEYGGVAQVNKDLNECYGV